MNRRNFFKSLVGSVVAVSQLKLDVIAKPHTLTLTSSPVIGTARKLKAVWTAECDQNLRAFYNISAEKEITEILTKELKNYEQNTISTSRIY